MKSKGLHLQPFALQIVEGLCLVGHIVKAVGRIEAVAVFNGVVDPLCQSGAKGAEIRKISAAWDIRGRESRRCRSDPSARGISETLLKVSLRLR